MRTAVSPLFFMTRDTYAKAAQHQNELNAFADYELARFWLAYTRSQNPYPPQMAASVSWSENFIGTAPRCT